MTEELAHRERLEREYGAMLDGLDQQAQERLLAQRVPDPDARKFMGKNMRRFELLRGLSEGPTKERSGRGGHQPDEIAGKIQEQRTVDT